MQETQQDVLKSKFGTPVKVDPKDIQFIEEPQAETKPVSDSILSQYAKPQEINPSDFEPISESETLNPQSPDIKEEYDENPEKRKEQMNQRIGDIDTNLNQLHKEERRLLQGLKATKYYLPGVPVTEDMDAEVRDAKLKEVREKIAILKGERYDLKGKTKTFTDTQKKEIADGTSLLTDREGRVLNDYRGLLEKGYTESDINFYYNQEQTKTFEEISKQQAKDRLKAKDLNYLFTWDGFNNVSTNKIFITDTGEGNEMKALTELYAKIKNGAEWNGYGQLRPVNKTDRINTIIKAVQDYVDDISTKQAVPPEKLNEWKKNKEFEYSKYMSKLFFYDEKDNSPSLEGMQSFAEAQIGQINKVLEENNAKYMKLKQADASGKLNGQRDYLEYINKERMILEGLKTINEQISKIPNQRAGIGDLYKPFSERGVIGSTEWKDLLTVGIREAQRMNQVYKTSEKLQNGEFLSWAEQQLLETYNIFEQAQSKGTKGKLYQAVQGAVNMIPYIASFGISKALVYDPVKYVTKEALETVIPKSLAKKVIPISNQNVSKVLAMKNISPAKIVKDWVPRVTGALGQSAVQYQYTSKEAQRRMLPDMTTDIDDEMAGFITEIDKNSGEGKGEAWLKAFGTTLAEFGTEHSGEYLTKLRKTFGRTVNSMMSRPIPEKYFMQQHAKLFGYKSVKDKMASFVKNGLGWNGIVEEYTEELANQMVNRLFTGDKILHGSSAWEKAKNFFDEQLVTAMTVGIVGMGMNAAQKTYSYARFGDVGDDVLYGKKDKNGKKSIVRIPKEVHDEMMKVFNSGPLIDGIALDDVLDKYINSTDKDKRLNKDQVQFLLDLSIEKGSEMYERAVLIEALNKAGIKTEEVLEPGEESDIETGKEAEDTKKLLTPNDVTKILKKNRKKFANKYPLLYQENLLPRDVNTGQMLDPTPSFLNSMLEQIDKKIETEKDPLELGKLQYHQRIVEGELEELINQISLPFNYRKPSEKHQALSERIDQGEKLTGRTSLVAPKTILITLDDGSQVKAYIGSEPGINESKEAYEERAKRATAAASNHATITIEKEAKEDWNPEDKAREMITDRFTGEVSFVPYGDRLNVIADGKKIAAVEFHDYGYDKLRSVRYRKAVEIAEKGTKDIIDNMLITPEGTQLNEKEKERIQLIVENLVYDLASNLDIETADTIPWLIDHIKNDPNIPEYLKELAINFINHNKDTIEKHVMTKRFSTMSKTKVSALDLEWPEDEGTEGVGSTAAQKLAKQIKTFAPIFRQMSERSGKAREEIELEFHKLVTGPLKDSVVNEDTYIAWLNTSRTSKDVNNILINYLLERGDDGKLIFSFDKMRSAINFYSNVVLVKQFAKIVDASGIRNQDLNPSQSYESLERAFLDKLQELGPDRIMQKINEAAMIRNAAFKDKENKFTPEQRSKALHDQFDRDLNLLADITGIDRDTWLPYFSSQTKETIQLSDTSQASKKDFEIYENLLNSVAYRPSGNAFYLWRQSNLMFNLMLNTGKAESVEQFEQMYRNYFVRSKEEESGRVKSYSNLYKLSTLITGENSIALSGSDVQGNNFSSFQANNDILYTAKNIQNSIVNNPLANYYKSLNKPMQIVMMNGLHNRITNQYEKGTPAVDLSMEDIWVIFMTNFAEGKSTYLQNIGQFADKPYLYQVEVPKITFPSAEQLMHVNTLLNGELERVVDFLRREAVIWNDDIFNNLAERYPTSIPQNDRINYYNDKKRAFLRAFIYNYVMNQRDINEIFFGSMESYPDGAVDLFKRAGSSNSPGYNPDMNVEGGVGKSFRYAVINEKKIFHNDKLLTSKGFDGCVFFLDDIGKKLQVSMGDIYARKKDYSILTTMKALCSWKNEETNRRGLVKGNWYNIETLSRDVGSETLKAIRQFMLENNIEVLAIDSSAKKMDEGEKINFFDEKGNINPDVKLEEGKHIVNKTWDKVFIQQDLRHSMNSKTAKAPSQNLTTILALDNGTDIANLIYNIQNSNIDALFEESESGITAEVKAQWVLNNINEHSQPELLALLEMGLTVNDPVYHKMMRKIIAAGVSKRGLQVPVNRTVMIEIPDVDGLLDPMRKVIVNGEEKSLLPDCAASIPGGRTFNYKFNGKPEEAIKYVEEHKEEYRDLYDQNDVLMKWEITERNGVIPGELVFLTRVPNSGFSTFDVARLKLNLQSGNFAMINRVGQVASSSDFDGDMRYVQTMYKRNGLTFFDIDNNPEGIANQIMRMVASDYGKGKFFNNIVRNIDVDAYDKIVEKIPKNIFPTYDPRAFQDSRLNNKVGLDMKGGMTNLLTVYSIISRYHIPLRTTFDIRYSANEVNYRYLIDRIATDRYGAIRAHLENFLTMFFDNQKDPKVERMGFNEITGNMFVLMLIGNESNDASRFSSFESHYKHILNKVEEQVAYFTSPMMQDFIRMMRADNGGMRATDPTKVFDSMFASAKKGTKPYSTDDVKQLKKLHSLSKELSDIKALHGLTQTMPATFSDFIRAKELVRKAKTNSREDGFRLFDMRNILDSEGNFTNELRIIDKVIDFAEKHIYDDIVDNTETGKQVYAYILDKMAEAQKLLPRDEENFVPDKKFLTEKEMNTISSTLNNIFNIRALGVRLPFSKVRDRLVKIIRDMKAENPDNNFLKQIEVTNDGIIQVLPVNKQKKLFEIDLERARADFDDLPTDTKELFAAYQMMKYGTSTVTSNGGFYTFFGPKFKVEISRRAREEFLRWRFDEISPMERLAVAEWTIRASKSKQIRKLQDFNTTADRLVDFFTDPTLSHPIHRDVIEGLESVEDIDSYNKRFGSSGSNVHTKDIFAYIESITNSGPIEMSFKTIKERLGKPFIEHTNRKNILASKYFPAFPNPTDSELQNMYGYDSRMQLVMTDDKALSNFIFQHFKEQFPGIQMFSDRAAFYEYVRQNTLDSLEVNLNAIGHAFRSAVFVDPNKALQDTMFHEYAHIYWRNLPDTNPVKKALRDLYSSHYGPQAFSPAEIEEKIIRHIGRLGTDYAANFIDASILDKFLDLVKRFWNEVKIYFGRYEKTDLVNNMIYHIWNNSDKIIADSKIGAKQIDNMIEVDRDAENIEANDVHKQYKIGGQRMPGITSVIDFFKFDKFDADKTIEQKLESFETFWQQRFKRRPTEDEIYDYVNHIETSWWDNTKAGTVIHAVAAEVFEGKTVDQKVITNNFVGNSAQLLRESFSKLKSEILEKYPNAIFYAEKPIISVKYKIFGYADLIVDVGDNRLIVFDFKTTDKEFLNPDGTQSKYYNKTFSYMMPPLTKVKQSKATTNKLQLSIETAILEEQENENNPGQKNKVIGAYVVPVIRKLSGGKITEAHISTSVLREGEEFGEGNVYWRALDNIIKVKASRSIAVEMMEKYNDSRAEPNKNYERLKTMLEDSSVPFPIADKYLEAYSYFSNHLGIDIGTITHEHIESLLSNYVRGVYNKLLALDYSVEEINSWPAEMLVNIAARDKSRVDWEANKDAWWGKVEVSRNTVKKLNPKYADRIPGWYHLKINDMDHYFHDMGVKNVSVGDEILRIDNVTYDGKPFTVYSYHEVTAISKKGKFVDVRDKSSKEYSRISGLEDLDGLLVMSKGNEHLDKNIAENSYIPRYTEDVVARYEDHWLNDKTQAAMGDTTEGKKAFQRHMMSQKIVWSFFSKYNSIKELQNVGKNPDILKEFFSDLFSLKTKHSDVSDTLMFLLRDALINHTMANQIRLENRNGPSIDMPMTLNVYKIITNKDNGIFKDLKGYNTWAKIFHPSRKLDAEYVGIDWFMTGLDQTLIQVHKEQFDFDQRVRKLMNKLDYRRLTTIVGKKYEWKMPNDESLNSVEAEFLSLLYDHYYTRVPLYMGFAIEYERDGYHIGVNGYPRQIPVTRMHATKQEVIRKVGNKGAKFFGLLKWGGILWDILNDTTYDAIKFEVEKGKFFTWQEIKDQFVFENASDDEIQEYMGSRGQYLFRNIPGIRRLGIFTKGKLYNYYVQAQKIYKHGDDLNPPAAKTGLKVHAIGDRNVAYQTNHIIESETKVVQSNIFAYHMKDMVAPLDFILAGYEDKERAHDYIMSFVEKIMFHKSTELGTEWTAFTDAITQITSLRFISFSLKTQVFNAAIGQSQNIIREPYAYATGLGRIVSGKVSIQKAVNVLRSHGLGNLVDEGMFDTLAKRAGLDVSWRDKSVTLGIEFFKRAGYKPMEWVERFNQIPLFIGLMTMEELDSYDDNGRLIEGKTGLDYHHAMMISERVRDVQGDYGPYNAAPAWLNNTGGLIMQFFKWAPTAVDATIMPYHFSRNYMVRSGIIPSVRLLFKVIHHITWVNKSDKRRHEYLRKALLRWPEYDKVKQYNAWVDKTFTEKEERDRLKIDMKNIEPSVKKKQSQYLHGVSEYMQMLIVAGDNGTISIKQLSDQDRRNLWSAVTRTMLFILIKGTLMGDKRKSKQELAFTSDWHQFMTRFLTRYQGDLFIFLGQTQDATGQSQGSILLKKLENPVVAVDYLKRAVQFNANFWPSTVDVAGHLATNTAIKWGLHDERDYLRQWWRPDVGYYKRETLQAMEGDPKALFDFISLLPGGSAINFALKYRLKAAANDPYIGSLRDKGYPEEMINGVSSFILEDMTVEERKKLAEQGKAIQYLMKNAGIYEITKKDPVLYRDLINGDKIIKKEVSEIKDAAFMINMLKEHQINPEKLDSLIMRANELMKIENQGINQTEAEKISRFNKARELVNANPDIFRNNELDIDDLIPFEEKDTITKKPNVFQRLRTKKQ